MLARPERFFADRFGLTPSTMERLLGSTLARPGGPRRPLPRVPGQRRAGARGRRGQEGLPPREPGRRRPRPVRRAHRLRAHRRPLAAEPRGGRATGPRHRRPGGGLRRGGRGRARRAPRSLHARRAAHRRRSRRASSSSSAAWTSTARRARSARAAGHRHPRQRGRGRADRDAVGLDGGRRPAAHPAQRHRDRRGGRQARDRRLRRRRARGLRLLPGGRPLEALRPRGGAPGGGEARRGRGARRAS